MCSGVDAALPRASVSPAGAGEVHRSRRGTSGASSPENALRSLLEALTSPPYAPTQHLEREQALAKQFAEILHFTLSFDELKVPPRGPLCGMRPGGGGAAGSPHWDCPKAVSHHSPLGPSRFAPSTPSRPWPPPQPLTPDSPRQMTNPAIQNDFSYYRRTISRNRINNLQVRGQRRSPHPPPRGGLPQGGGHRTEGGLGWGSATPVVPIILLPCSWMRRAR